MQDVEHTFIASPAKGKVSARLLAPANATATLVFGHGAGAGIEHRHMQSIAGSLGDAGIATLRFNFPYMQSGGHHTDTKAVCVETFCSALVLATRIAPGPFLLGGHSFGGRMASHCAVDAPIDVAALIYYSFPLHPARKPGTRRADHMTSIRTPQLFLSGTRDALAELELLRAVVASLPHAELHELDTADHSFKTLKRARQTTEDVYVEAARVASGFVAQTLRDRDHA